MNGKMKHLIGVILLFVLLMSFAATAMALNVTDHDLYDWFEYYRD